MLRRRIEKLELALANSRPEDDSQFVYMEAMDLLGHSDRMLISHLALRYGTGEDVVNTPELDAVMARWTEAIAKVSSENRGVDSRSRGIMN